MYIQINTVIFKAQKHILKTVLLLFWQVYFHRINVKKREIKVKDIREINKSINIITNKQEIDRIKCFSWEIKWESVKKQSKDTGIQARMKGKTLNLLQGIPLF